MTPIPSQILLTAPFGELKDSASSARYHFRSDQRGDEQFVIMQRTTSGSGIFQWRGREWEVPPEHVFICLVPEESAYRFPEASGTPWHFGWINFYGPLAQSLCRSFREEYGPVLPLPSRSTAHTGFLDLAKMAADRVPRDPCDTSVRIFSFLMEWKRLLDQPQHRRADPVATVAHICQTRFREQLGVKELAAQVGLSREHLSRRFTERMKVSPAKYLRSLRSAAAREMLRRTNSSFSETALRCGFPSAKALRQALQTKPSARLKEPKSSPTPKKSPCSPHPLRS